LINTESINKSRIEVQ